MGFLREIITEFWREMINGLSVRKSTEILVGNLIRPLNIYGNSDYLKLV